MFTNNSRPARSSSWRRAVALPLALATMVGLASCASPGPDASGAGGADSGAVVLRMSTWGNDSRTRLTQQALDEFTKANPDIKVTLENSAYSGYWDRLATQVAANDAPDVIKMDEVNFGAYTDRGVLADLAPLASSLPTADISPSALGTGAYEGKQYGIPMGLTTMAIAVNPKLFEKAGVKLPDDKTWTWDDYATLASELTSKLDEGEYGTVGMGLASTDLSLFARQRGEELFPTAEQKPISEETVKEYYGLAKRLVESKGAPPVALQVESSTSALDTTLMATNKAAMSLAHTSQIASYSRAAGTDFKLLRMPAHEAGKHGMVFTASQWTINGRSRNAEASAKLIDFIVSDPKAADILTTERGIPAIAGIRDQVADKVDAASKVGLDFAADVEGELADPPQVAPAKASSFNSDFTLISAEVLFDRISVDEGAQRLVSTINGYNS